METERYGKRIEYDPLWKGPMHRNRSMTDLTWLTVFLIFFVVYISCGIYGLKSGKLGVENTTTIDHPRSSGSFKSHECISTEKCFWYPVIITTICGGIVAFIYVVLLKWFAVSFFYISICMFLAYMSVGIAFAAKAYADDSSKNSWSLPVLIILSVFIVVLILVVILNRKKIRLACQLVKESSKAVIHLPTTLIYPILSMIFYLLVILFTVAVFLSLLTIKSHHVSSKIGNKISDESGNTLFNNLTRNSSETESIPTYVYFLHAINLFGFYWIFFFISGLQFLILGGTFGTWYWTFNKENVGNYSLIESISRSLRYHLGTVAVGSFILAVIQIIRFILNAIQESIKKADNPILLMLVCCCRCLIDLLNAILSFITYNAYIMCAIHGENFCNSAKSSYRLLMRNILNVVTVNSVANLLFTMATLLIASLAAGGIVLYSSKVQNLHLSAVAITAVGTYLIASIMFSVQTVAVDTIFLCVLEDVERNNGSSERPYFMSNKLRQLLKA